MQNESWLDEVPSFMSHHGVNEMGVGFNAAEALAYSERLLDKELADKAYLTGRGRFVIGSLGAVLGFVGIATTVLFQSSHVSETLEWYLAVFVSLSCIAPGLVLAVASLVAYLDHKEDEYGHLSAQPRFDDVMQKWYRTQPLLTTVSPRSIFTALSYDHVTYKNFSTLCDYVSDNDSATGNIAFALRNDIIGTHFSSRDRFREFCKLIRDYIARTLREADKFGPATGYLTGYPIHGLRHDIDNLFHVLHTDDPPMPDGVKEFINESDRPYAGMRADFRSSEKANFLTSVLLLACNDAGQRVHNENTTFGLTKDPQSPVFTKYHKRLVNNFFLLVSVVFTQLHSDPLTSRTQTSRGSRRIYWLIRWMFSAVRRMLLRVSPFTSSRSPDPLTHGFLRHSKKRRFDKKFEEPIDRLSQVISCIILLIKYDDTVKFSILSPRILVRTNTYYSQIKEWVCRLYWCEPRLVDRERWMFAFLGKDHPRWRGVASTYFAAQEQRSANWNLWWRVRVAEMRLVQSLKFISFGLVVGVALFVTLSGMREVLGEVALAILETVLLDALEQLINLII